MFIIVSACLAGYLCRYDGKYQGIEAFETLFQKKYLIPLCPEVLGGLDTPRIPCEWYGDLCINKIGEDKTKEFLIGAMRAYRYAMNSGTKIAILKSRSTSCGVGMRYDGTFSKKLMPVDGTFAQMLRQSGFTVLTEENYFQYFIQKKYLVV